MNGVAWTRAAALYMPLMAAAFSFLLTSRRPRRFAALLLSFLWVATTLLVMQRLNQMAGWWTFPNAGASLCGMPLELYLGWVILWGLVPQIVFSSSGIAWPLAIFALIDLYLMPLCKAIVHLQPTWLAGEAFAIALVLLPALCIARWTEHNTHLKARAALQTITAGLLFLFLIPEIIFALRSGDGWLPLLRLPEWQLQLSIQLVLLLALPGVAAVVEFATRGDGTPIPYDPPTRLVISGIYRYLANPMQTSCTLVMFCWAGLLRNGWLLLAAAMSAIYSAGIADWDERRDLKLRFGDPWREYSAGVRNWLPRWRPFHSGESAKLYIAATCGPCSELRRWLEARNLVGLEILDAETLPPGTIRRMRYDPRDGSRSVEGVRALGRALEHLHLLWALAGAALRLPLIWQGIQLVMDASGLGPRIVPAYTCAAQGKTLTEGGMPQTKAVVLTSASTPNDR
ncbi:protein-S-isoprenylcysteine O-methyltransferase Ste14 [Granulicella aggregans]|uniref:Protein-S-isoprenylcysteine O-methyltransferase Ste14 n=1 Tax=Granulicella aggregans TaxID=474949 RepID=A0A7W7ZC13_9BACT|nr:methyltransferase [Granulicella aggregans]MBB5057145.1 protein-S-isoprenylcysteine O-methyltransferase Ste14 [Granulicella aggregans]